MSTESIGRAVELFIGFGAAWLVGWSIVVNRIRLRSNDKLAGQWLALSWGFLLLGVVVGTFTRFAAGEGPSYGAPFIIVGILIGLYAMRKGYRNTNPLEKRDI